MIAIIAVIAKIENYPITNFGNCGDYGNLASQLKDI